MTSIQDIVKMDTDNKVNLARSMNSVLTDLANFFGPEVPLTSLSDRPHMVGDFTDLIVAASGLLRVMPSLNDPSNTTTQRAMRRHMKRLFQILTTSTNIAADKKGLKFSVTQMAEYISNFRYVKVSESPEAQNLIHTLGLRYKPCIV